uniref:Germinal-center associated nuclear protein n=1 Tax=Paramormyrops kingsleyae TaxID=1676925 RepID=A0A3B3T147_9TELE|nr:germinal-center associated nuclear protein isoform X1 [Paramormyrops kingsleyae]
MNPSGLFGRPQGGAFQSPGAPTSGLFPFGQQNAPFGQPPAFGQGAVQTSLFSTSSAFGQTGSLFGQPGGTASGQAPTFGLPGSGSQTPSFGQSDTRFAPPASFGQPAGVGQSSIFNQSSTFPQTSAFGQTAGFTQQTPGFGGSSAISQSSSVPPSSGSSQPLRFGQPSVGSSSVFSPGSVQGRGFSTSEFSFKPSDAAVFKPIFSASPEPAGSQAVSESFGSSPSSTTTTSMDSSGPAPAASGFLSGTLGFSFSQPIAVSSSILPTKDAHPSTTQEFSFSEPAAPSGGAGNGLGGGSSQAASVSSTPPYRFSASSLHEPQPPFGVVRFGPLKPKAEAGVVSVEVHGGGGEVENAGEAAAKGTKRKEEMVEQISEEPQVGADSAPRHPPKRPLVRGRGPVSSIFRSALTSILKTPAPQTRREPKRIEEPQPDWGEAEHQGSMPPTTSHSPSTPPRSQAPTREVLERAEELDPEAETASTVRRARRLDSTDSLGGMSPSEAMVLQCKNIPASLNSKDILGEHFRQFGRVQRIFCRPQKNLAIVHFHDHASAAKAKKKGKLLHRHELTIFWQRKKQSPGEKGQRPPDGPDPQSQAGGFESPPVCKALSKSTSSWSSSSSLSRGSPAKKLLATKALQFESEPQMETNPDSLGSEHPASSLPSSLFHLIGQVAETAEEKYRLLEQRDKILRQARPKRTDLDLSKVFVGTCPDMCPEKERYMRETRNQLSSFEVIPNTEKVDHTSAIKEYSRSSADQEEPLPHELRPLTVLNMTMDYLVTQIMDQGEDNYRDWYDFVWNRTRGIRKDITQQHLCDPLTVSLIEKCARFHIHCAHHLCQEPMMSFDIKINNENLTKCLQSLKEMYQDLASKNIYCTHEAEFRQYSVLLKLNDGDILREVQQFRAELRNSAEVKFAVQAFAAVNSNNFVRFFKLVKVASYLAGCILHRYFDQVRHEALRALNVAYISRGSTTFPVEDLVRMLMFQNAGEASDFALQYGLTVDAGMVELSRTTYQEPEIQPRPKRSAAIARKRVVLVGQVVNGAPLPNPPQHTPVYSFDSRNKYRGDGQPVEAGSVPRAGAGPAAASSQRPPLELDARTLQCRPKMPSDPAESAGPPGREESGALGASPPEAPPVAPPTPPPPEPVYTEQDITAEVEAMLEEVVQVEAAEVAATGAEYISTALSVCNNQVEAVLSEVVEQMLREVSAAEIQAEREHIAEEKRRMEEARRRQEHEELLARLSKILCTEITQEVLRDCIVETASTEIRCAQEEQAECVARSSQDVCEVLLEETLCGELTLLAQDVLEAGLLSIRRFIKRWRDVVAVRRQLKRQMRDFPAAPGCVDPRFRLQALAPSAPPSPCLDRLARGVVNLGHAGDLSVSCTRLAKMRRETEHQMKVHLFYQQLLSESVWAPLDLLSLVAASVSSPPDTIFWKAALLLPSDHERDASVANQILTEWLESKFGSSEKQEHREMAPNGHMQTLSISSGLRGVGERMHTVHVCVKVARGPLSEEGQLALEKRKELMGMGALLMLLPSAVNPGADEEDGDIFLLSALLQLRQIQQANAWPQALPLVVVVPGQAGHRASDERLVEDLMLQTLIEEGLISEYMFIHIPETTNEPRGSEQVRHAVRWLAARSVAPAQLVSQTLVQLVEAGLCREFACRLHRDRRDRDMAGLPSQGPAPVISLYNAVLAFLAGLVSSPSLAGLSWPVAEFSVPGGGDCLPHLLWNSAEHLEWLQGAVLSLRLPDWQLPAVKTPWSQLVASIFQYVSQIPWSRHSQPLLMSQLENLLERLRQDCVGRGGGPDEEPTFWEVPWDEIVMLCVEHRLRDWNPPGCPVSEDVISDDGEIPVYFLSDGLRGFIQPSCWVDAVKQTHRDKQQEKAGCHQSMWPHPRLAQPRLQQKLFHSMVEDPESGSGVVPVLDAASSPQDLLARIEEEKAQSRRFEDQLRTWLDVESLGPSSSSSPLFLPSSLLSVPEIMVPSPKMAAPPALALQKERSVCSDQVSGAAISMTWRLQELEQLISANREEELACELKLSCLLDIVDD